MFGGNGFATHKKYNHIDDAKDFIHAAQTDMRFFHKELLDAHQGSDLDGLDVEIPGLLTFADFVFDGFFIDSVVQGEIEDSLEKAKEQKNEIDKIIRQLNFRCERRQKDLNRLEKEKKQLLENSGA